jgi:Tfp pilus assembly protein PilX
VTEVIKGISNLLAGNRGMALVLVLVFTAALLILGAALLTNALNEKLITGYQKQELQQQYLAEAGLEAGIALLQTDFYYNQVLTGTLMDGSFQVTFEHSGADSRCIRSAGTVDAFTYVLQIEVYLNPDGSLSYGQWQRL